METARSDVIKHIRRRWMQIRDKGGFTGLEMWALKEIGNGDKQFSIHISAGQSLILTTFPTT